MSDNSTELEFNHHKAENKPAEVSKQKCDSSESNKCILVHMCIVKTVQENGTMVMQNPFMFDQCLPVSAFILMLLQLPA